MKDKWKNFIKSSNHKFTFLHIEDLESYNLEKFKNQLPICIEKIKDTYSITLSSEEMDKIKDQDELISFFKKKSEINKSFIY